MTWHWLRQLAACVAVGLAVASAHALGVGELQRLLQSAPRAPVPFTESRESPWLSAPVTSSGIMRSTPGALEKQVLVPRQETWRLLPDRIEWQDAAGGAPRQILFSQSPALAALSDVMRNVVAGDLVALQRDFTIEISGDERVWRAQLTPRKSEIGRVLSQVELQGTGRTLQVIIVTQRQGERTTTRLQP